MNKLLLLLLFCFSFATAQVEGHASFVLTNTSGTESFSVSASPTASNHDAEENQNNGAMDITSISLELNTDIGVALSDNGILFPGLNIPAGATITSAYVEFTSMSNQSNDCDVDIKGELSDTPAVFTTTANNMSGRTRTTANVDWDNIPAWSTSEVGPDTQTPSLVSIIQEIVDGANYDSTDNIVLIFEGANNTTLNLVREGAAYDHTTLDPPVLYIEYDN